MTNVLEVKEKYEAELMKIQGVTGVGTSLKENKIVVYVVDESVIPSIPEILEGYQIKIIVTGELGALE